MGPVRGRLILLFAPGPAWAEVCDKERPLWDGAPVSAWDEFGHMALNPVALIALVLVVVLALTRRRVTTGIAFLLSAALLFVFLSPDPPGWDHVERAAMREGCIGNPAVWYLFLLSLLAFSLWHFVRAIRQRGT